MKFMILPGARLRSASVPMEKPGVSTSSTMGNVEAVAQHEEAG